MLPEAVALEDGEEGTSSLAELKADPLHPKISGTSEMTSCQTHGGQFRDAATGSRVTKPHNPALSPAVNIQFFEPPLKCHVCKPLIMAAPHSGPHPNCQCLSCVWIQTLAHGIFQMDLPRTAKGGDVGCPRQQILAWGNTARQLPFWIPAPHLLCRAHGQLGVSLGLWSSKKEPWILTSWRHTTNTNKLTWIKCYYNKMMHIYRNGYLHSSRAWLLSQHSTTCSAVHIFFPTPLFPNEFLDTPSKPNFKAVAFFKLMFSETANSGT